MSHRARAARRCWRGGSRTRRAATAPSAAAMCRRPWCPALDRLQAGVRRYLHSADFQAEFNHELRPGSAGPTALVPRRDSEQALGRRGVAQARGPGAHRRAQDQQRARPGAAGAGGSGAQAHHRRDRRGPAWRGERRGRARAWGCPASSTWARSTWSARRRMSAACSCWARPSCRSPAAIGRLRAAIDEALRDWVSDPDGTYYLLGSAVGPHPVSVSGARTAVGDRARSARADARARRADFRTSPFACVGGGSNAIGLFHPFLGRRRVEIIGIEAGGRGSGPRRQCGLADLRHSRRAAWQLLPAAAGCVRPDAGDAFGIRRPRLSGRGPRARATSWRAAACATSARPTRRRWMRSPSARSAKASCPRSRPRTRSSARAAARNRIPDARILIGCSGRGDKDMPILQRTLLDR